MRLFKKKKTPDIKGEIYAFRILIDTAAEQSKLEKALDDLLMLLKKHPIKISVENCPFYQPKSTSKHDQKLMLLLLKQPLNNCPFCNILVFPENNPTKVLTKDES